MQSKISLFTFFCFTLIFFCAEKSFTQDKIFKTIQSGDYEKAKEKLLNELSKSPNDPVLHYDAAWFYYQEDHKDFKPDSAWYHIVKCNLLLSKIKEEKQLNKLSSQGIREATVTLLQNNIERRAYEIAENKNTIESWEYFIKKFPGAKKQPDALENRNALAFSAAKENFSYESFKDFMQKYPNAAQLPEAKKLYESLLYKTLTQANTWKAYKDFIDKHPNSPYADEARSNYEELLFKEFAEKSTAVDYAKFIKQHPESRYVPQAEDSLYHLFITDGSPENYYHFIQLYPKNKNIKEAWFKLYYLVTADFTPASLDYFEKNYPLFPYTNVLKEEKKLATLKLMSVESGDEIGFMDTVSKKLIFQGKYVEVFEFSGRYAAVLKDSLWGYINRNGNMIVPPQYGEANDFVNGFAVVGKGNCIEGECLYGLIDQAGAEILPLAYEEVFDITDAGLALVKKEEKGYGFSNRIGKFVIPLQYDDAFSFSQKLAAVKNETEWGFIDAKGDTIIPFQYSNAGSFAEDLAPAADSMGLWGYIDKTGKWLITPKFHFANSFEAGKALVLVKERNKKGIEITLEKTIDKAGAFVEQPKPKIAPVKKGKKK